MEQEATVQKVNKEIEQINFNREFPISTNVFGAARWFLLTAILIFIATITSLIFLSENHIFRKYLFHNNMEPDEISWILNLAIFVLLIIGPTTTFLINLFGFKPLVIVTSIFAGLLLFVSAFLEDYPYIFIITILAGSGVPYQFFYIALTLSVTIYFNKYRPLAIGMIESASYFGLYSTGLIKHFLTEFGRTWTMILFSLIILFCSISALIFPTIKKSQLAQVNLNEEINGLTTNNEVLCENIQQKPFHKRACDQIVEILTFFKNPIFLLFSFSYICFQLTFFITNIFINLQLNDKEEEKYFRIVVICGNTIAPIVFGIIYNLTKSNRLWIFIVTILNCGVAAGICYIFLQFKLNFYMILVIYSIFVVSMAGCQSMISIILIELFGMKKLPNAFGLFFFYHNLTILLGNSFRDWFIKDHYKMGTVWFISADIKIIACGLILFAIPPLQRKLKRHLDKKNSLQTSSVEA